MKWGSSLLPVLVGDSLAWDKIGVMFAFTQFAGTRSYEADCRFIPFSVRSYRLGHLWTDCCLLELIQTLVSSCPGLSFHL